MSELPPPKPVISGVNPIAAFFVSLLVRALAALSDKGRTRLGRFVGRLVFLLGIRKRVTLDNLRHAFPEKPRDELLRIARGAYESMAIGMVESIASVERTAEELDSFVEVENWGTMKADIDSGKGVLVATAHFGNWELLGEVLTRRGLKISVVVKPLKGALNAKIVEARQKAGVKLVLARGALRAAIEDVKAGYVMAMLVDQVLPEKHGVFVPFFGRPACTTPAISVAAQRTGAPVYVVMGAREGDRLRMYVEGPIPFPNSGDPDRDVVDHTATVTAIIEKYIRRYPEQWLWLHRRWKVQPSGAQSVMRAPTPKSNVGAGI